MPAIGTICDDFDLYFIEKHNAYGIVYNGEPLDIAFSVKPVPTPGNDICEEWDVISRKNPFDSPVVVNHPYHQWSLFLEHVEAVVDNFVSSSADGYLDFFAVFAVECYKSGGWNSEQKDFTEWLADKIGKIVEAKGR